MVCGGEESVETCRLLLYPGMYLHGGEKTGLGWETGEAATFLDCGVSSMKCRNLVSMNMYEKSLIEGVGDCLL